MSAASFREVPDAESWQGSRATLFSVLGSLAKVLPLASAKMEDLVEGRGLFLSGLPCRRPQHMGLLLGSPLLASTPYS